MIFAPSGETTLSLGPFFVSVILLALLGIFGLNYLKKNGPRERVVSPDGAKIIVEEMSYYIGGDKLFGKVFKPSDENGNFPDSLGPMPVVVYFHKPLKTEWWHFNLVSRAEAKAHYKAIK